MLSLLLQVQKKISQKICRLGIWSSPVQVVLVILSWLFHHSFICHEQGSSLLDPMLSVAAFGRFPFLGLLHVLFLHRLDGESMHCFLISRQRGLALFFPVTGLEISFPGVGTMAYSKVQECWYRKYFSKLQITNESIFTYSYLIHGFTPAFCFLR